jgi:hypothetical protein
MNAYTLVNGVIPIHNGYTYRCTHLLAHGLLFVSRVDGNYIQAHGLGILLG